MLDRPHHTPSDLAVPPGDIGDVRDFGEGRSPPARPSLDAGYTYAGLVSIKEYRQIMSDEESADALIISRLEHLEALCRNIARSELARLFHPSS